jgi:hypothetical protein
VDRFLTTKRYTIGVPIRRSLDYPMPVGSRIGFHNSLACRSTAQLSLQYRANLDSSCYLCKPAVPPVRLSLFLIAAFCRRDPSLSY